MMDEVTYEALLLPSTTYMPTGDSTSLESLSYMG